MTDVTKPVSDEACRDNELATSATQGAYLVREMTGFATFVIRFARKAAMSVTSVAKLARKVTFFAEEVTSYATSVARSVREVASSAR